MTAMIGNHHLRSTVNLHYQDAWCIGLDRVSTLILPNCFSQQTHLPQLGSGPAKGQPHRKRDSRIVLGFSLWTEAWNRYLWTCLTIQPSMSFEFATYQTLIATLFAHYAATARIHYYCLFRQAVSQDASLRWDTVKEDIHVFDLPFLVLTIQAHRSPL